jgi:Ras-related protein Rab-32
MAGRQPEQQAPPGTKEFLFKVLVVGDMATGKTAIIRRCVEGAFSENYKTTIGVDFALKTIKWGSNTHVYLQLWDIAGQERYGNLTRVYYKEAVAAFVVFDLTRNSSFESVKRWKDDIDNVRPSC